MLKNRIIFNGSYFSKKPNGISLVSRELAKSINPNIMTKIAPFSDNQTKFQKIPNSWRYAGIRQEVRLVT